MCMQIPQAATVWCMPIEMLAQGSAGMNHAAYHTWDWQPSYKELDLRACRRDYSDLFALSQGTTTTFSPSVLCDCVSSNSTLKKGQSQQASL